MLLCVLGLWSVQTTPADFLTGQWDPIIYISRRLQEESTDPSDSGAVEIYARFDANRDGYYDLMSADAMNGSNGYVHLWLGGPTGYSGSNAILFPTDSGGNCDMADLNLDGWPELIHSGWGQDPGCRIYWGSASAGGPDPGNYTTLPNGGAEAVYVYDLDMDSYLDILLAGDDGNLYVYWGSASGYSSSNRSTRNLSTVGHNIEVADLNKDGYPDVVLPTGNALAAEVTVLWGDATPRNLSDNGTWSDYDTPGYAHGLTLGDFNNDGWIDIVRAGYNKYLGSPGARVYFSNNGSFSSSNSVHLDVGHCYGGSAAYDFNGDGYLDLVFFPGRPASGTLYKLKMYLNTGTSPYFSDGNSLEFGQDGYYSGGFIWDFNQDGYPEIFANNGCGWGLESYVYWGVRSDGTYDSVQSLPVVDDHHGGFRECGNVYDRSPYAWYESRVFSNTDLQSEATLSWISWDSTDVGAQIRMFIRTRTDGTAPWTDWLEVSNGSPVSASPYFPARDIQYRAEFHWQNPAFMPWLERVELTTEPLYAGTPENSEQKGQGPSVISGKHSLLLIWPGEPGLARLFAPDGRLVATGQVQNGKAEFNGLRPGIYLIKVSDQVLKGLVH